jgi:hypothetical protein
MVKIENIGVDMLGESAGQSMGGGQFDHTTFKVYSPAIH